MKITNIYDLTHGISKKTFHPFGSPQLESYETFEVQGCRSSKVTITLHFATHLDSPWHFVRDGKKLEDLSLDRFVGEGLVVDLSDKYGPSCGKNLCISQRDLEMAVEKTEKTLQSDDMIIINTGWHHLFDTHPQDYYAYSTAISDGAGSWLAEKKVKLVGIDACDVDDHKFFAQPPFHPPNHGKNFLPNNILIIENVGGEVDKVVGKKLLIIASPLNIKGIHGSSSPIRLIALETE
ncbi:cyclase family protein [Candidatus Aerophobetes bacterium]|uniref:Cyclase family protein n=1 Tax=Aerophobetes bacterium TaxID=2030807 RepID=A0A523W7Q3_UNCAE|nr:MAG: cyclase family protein [Candidatus Aerophobetes bacterium]